jgi:hypothetical protein
MKLRAASAMAARPTAGAPPLIASDPSGWKNAATDTGLWLHHAAVYREANSLSCEAFVMLS